MLNKDNIRELAYLARVTDIKPMDADKLECVCIQGWNCVCSKSSFKIGDIGVFFEIDSKLPDAAPFNEIEFLKTKDFKIKSQKIRGCVSQGLLLPISDFGWVKDDADDSIIIPPEKNGKTEVISIDDESKFLTSRLNVTYAVSEDNQRKSKPNKNAKYNSMTARHPKLAKKKWFRWMMKREWGRKVLFFFLGKKKDSPKEWPVGKFPGVSKTDQERCLAGSVLIETDHGFISISDIVNQRLDVKVRSYNFDTKELEYRDVVDYQVFKADKTMYEIKCYENMDHPLICTGDHKIYTQNGFIPASDIKIDDLLSVIDSSGNLTTCKVRFINKISFSESFVYDIEVEHNHNFFASNKLTHNCENMPWVLNDKTPFIRTMKCDGSSGTFILERKKHNKFEFYVCSRNVRMADENQECFFGSDNYYWEVAKKYDIENKMKDYLNNNPDVTFVCWQGEICGPGIQKNPHGLTETHLFCFHMTDSVTGRFDIRDAAEIWKSYNMEVVPIDENLYIMPDDFEEFKQTATGFYDSSVCEGKEKQAREGYVYYKVDEPTFSFKNVSREYLLKHQQ